MTVCVDLQYRFQNGRRNPGQETEESRLELWALILRLASLLKLSHRLPPVFLHIQRQRFLISRWPFGIVDP